MSEKDNLVDIEAAREKGEKDSSAAIPVSDNQVAATSMADPMTEEQLPEANHSGKDIGGSGIATGEVRAVEPPSGNTSKRPLVAALMVVILIAIGYFMIVGSSPEQGPQAAKVERQPIPKRQPIEKQIEEKVVDQKQVAAVETRQNDTKTADKKVIAAEETVEEKDADIQPPAEQVVANDSPLYQVVVGPYLNSLALEKATTQLKELGFEAQTIQGRGMVSMIRLREGVYPADEARRRLETIKKQVRAAFLLPDGERRALYVGSFADPQRAARLTEELSQKGVKVTEVRREIEMSGKMLIALKADQDTARQVAALLNKSGLQTKIVRN